MRRFVRHGNGSNNVSSVSSVSVILIALISFSFNTSMNMNVNVNAFSLQNGRTKIMTNNLYFKTRLFSTSEANDSSSASASAASTVSNQSLSQMEDAVEQTLESNQPLNLSSSSNPNSNQNQILQHTIRAPTTSSSSSNTFHTQESSFENEDEEARQRQSFINSYLEKDDENWKKERLEKILGKYKHVLGTDGDGSSGDGTGDGTDSSDKLSAEERAKNLEEGWRKVIEEERKRIEHGTLKINYVYVIICLCDHVFFRLFLYLHLESQSYSQ
jgi:hypothetical protein